MTSQQSHSRAGMTLIEILVAVSLLGLLSVGLVTALQVAAGSWSSSRDARGQDRRIANANALLHAQFSGVTPVEPLTLRPGMALPAGPFFQGQPTAMRFVSSYSMTEGVRGGLQIVELQASPGQEGTRLILTQTPYQGPLSVGRFITGIEPSSEPGSFHVLFTPLETRADSLIVADRLSEVRFSYLRGPRSPNEPDAWVSVWDQPRQLPQAIRVDLRPLEDVGRLRPVALVSEVRARYGRERRLPRR